ncbi:MAG: potassium-transporting ATPase KdpC subunit [Microbacteriaceae bacterium]|jgi:K+-transporting ATPase ATPase C chain|nr:potassium-transporting ATPase KdpC subunit [Microbacteriaceae bacterium]
MSSSRGIGRQYWVAIRAMIVLTVVVGVIYPLVITGVGQLAFNANANGSMVKVNGTTVGSSLIGQSFTDKKGNALAEWFQSRPSAAGTGYDAGASSGSNYGPNNPTLTKAIDERKTAIESLDGVTANQIPADALTASASGLDPQISPAYALLQVNAVATARGLDASKVKALVESKIQGRELGYLGEPTVNVLQLNIALAEMSK